MLVWAAIYRVWPSASPHAMLWGCSSLRFYRDTLGVRIAGESENYGTEQEHLNNVFGARLRITTLRAATGPGVELLEYLAPRDGRARPADWKANDLAHWQTTVTASNLDDAWTRLRSVHAPFDSPGIVPIPERPLGFDRALHVRDPDGHAIELIAP